MLVGRKVGVKDKNKLDIEKYCGDENFIGLDKEGKD